MNWYDIYQPVTNRYWEHYTYGLESQYCCAAVEAVIENEAGSAEERISKIIRSSCAFKRSLILWHLLPDRNKMYRDVEKILSCLPATTPIAEYKNRRSGYLIRSYVTNLQQEWDHEAKA
jgi:hypothetical protein